MALKYALSSLFSVSPTITVSYPHLIMWLFSLDEHIASELDMGTRMKSYYSLMKNFKSKQLTAHGHYTDRDMNIQQQITQYINWSINKVL